MRWAEKQVEQFYDDMACQVKIGKEELEKRPSLGLQCWNATRWLGRYKCLKSLCRAYEYILQHLSDFAETRGESAKDRQTARDLYHKLSSYDKFTFIYMYRDLASFMAKTTKLLQQKHIQIRDVGRRMLILYETLKTNYPPWSNVPTKMLGDAQTDEIMDQLFDGNADGTVSAIVANV